MDIIRWRVLVKTEMDLSVGENVPQVGIAVKLACRICSNMIDPISAGVELHPSNLQLPFGQIGTPSQGSAWNSWIISRRLADNRYCPNCGVNSIIPPAQQAALIELTNGEVTLEWLHLAILKLELQHRRIPLSSGRSEGDRRYRDYLYQISATDVLREVGLDWHGFNHPSVPGSFAPAGSSF